MSALITIKNCKIRSNSKVYLPKIDWQMNLGETWLITGASGSGKDAFIKALAGDLDIEPNEENLCGTESLPLYSSIFGTLFNNVKTIDKLLIM